MLIGRLSGATQARPATTHTETNNDYPSRIRKTCQHKETPHKEVIPHGYTRNDTTIQRKAPSRPQAQAPLVDKPTERIWYSHPG